MYRTLISADELMALPAGDVVIVDCRFRLADPDWGHAAHAESHLPGAHYLHLDYHLSGVKSGRNGRHPLPDAERLAVVLGALGVGPDTQIVAYDDAGGMFAARLWWLARWLGHEAVAVLDGGLPAWLAAGGELSHEAPQPPRLPARFAIRASLAPTLDADAVLANLASPRFVVVDARAPDRFRGENETMDPVGGHIPGALNRPFADNLAADGRFKTPDRLAADWRALLGQRAPGDVVHQCGSGVTACHNLLAMEHAGLAGSRLYPGSWSEWCADPARPVATGAA
ncbi:sulfurtransferase [Crenobacter luteus]|uniref:3-mercaptopyruvate sulfurtransferase n=1 Tax=Crenobacter luteus TaxID=1452487 RepID=A0A165G1A9_9NEIS|nr:sulfurtransferase [Crenobacter luteus]KZE34822.1 3-mercaptopyruvate sulfurtransferase [Crenobacter luteus]